MYASAPSVYELTQHQSSVTQLLLGCESENTTSSCTPCDPAPPCLQIFAPLARLLGLYSIKEELEELSFKYSNPEAYSQMVKRMEVLSKTQSDVVEAVRPSCLKRITGGHQ